MKFTIGAAFAALAATTCMTTSAAMAETIKVGLLVPYSGVYAAMGKEIEDAFMLGLETYGKEVPGVTFDVIREDDEMKPQVGLAKTKKLILQDEIDVLTGIVSSGVTGAIRDTVHAAQVPMVISTSGNDEATGAQCSPYITRIGFSNQQVNRPLGTWLAEQGVKKVYTLAPDYAAGKQMTQAFVDAFKAAGGEVVASEYTPFQKTQDFGPYITNAKASGADAVYAFYAGGEAISFVKQYESFGAKAELPIYGPGFLTSQLYLEAEGAAAEGIVSALHYVPTIDTPENKAFVEAFKAKSGHLPSEFALQGYDAARAIIEAAKTGATDRASLAAALPKVAFTGPRGALTIDPATNNLIQPIYVYEIVKGENGATTQKVIATLPASADPANGCVMAAN